MPLPPQARFHKFRPTIDPATGALTALDLLDTVLLRTADGSVHFNGQNARKLNGDGSVLGASLDAEGIAADRYGNVYISDEYGPSLYK